MKINEILAKRKNSNIAPINRMGAPVKSKYTIAAQSLSRPTTDWGYVKGGDIAAGLASGLRGYLGMRGAMEDARNQQAYNDYLAQMAEQDRADKIAQQQAEMDYKDRALAQQAALAQNQLDAQAALKQQEIEAQNARAELARQQALADRDAQYAHEQAIYDRNRADAVSDLNAQNKAKQQAQYIQDMNTIAAKNLNAEDYNKWRENPNAYDIKGSNWFGRKLGFRGDLKPKQSNSFANLSDEDLLKGL